MENELRNELINAEHAVRNVFRKYIYRFLSSGDEMLTARADDLKDLLRKILNVLLGVEKSQLEHVPANSIIVSRRLLPSDTANIDGEHVLGILVKEGSPHSHSAILSRALGIPALTAVAGDIVDTIKNGDRLLIDANEGVFYLKPSRRICRRYAEKRQSYERVRRRKIRTTRQPVRTKNGTRVWVLANANSEKDFADAASLGCDGIGLFRIENLYLAAETMPNEHSLLSTLRQILPKIKGKPATLRFLDIGGDKRLPYLDTEEELSPYLGLRGIRLLLRHESLFRTQIRVFLKLNAEFNIRALIPMVTVPEEVDRVKQLIGECRAELRRSEGLPRKKLRLGAMIETPSAVICAGEIARRCDFLSIGTNDLTQYTMAAGRENPTVAWYYERGNEIIMRSVETVGRLAAAARTECSVCGEIAQTPEGTEAILRAGIRRISISPYLVPEIKAFIRGIEGI
jgi:phosphotransferase system enzyme I (PtsI)